MVKSKNLILPLMIGLAASLSACQSDSDNGDGTNDSGNNSLTSGAVRSSCISTSFQSKDQVFGSGDSATTIRSYFLRYQNSCNQTLNVYSCFDSNQVGASPLDSVDECNGLFYLDSDFSTALVGPLGITDISLFSENVSPGAVETSEDKRLRNKYYYSQGYHVAALFNASCSGQFIPSRGLAFKVCNLHSN